MKKSFAYCAASFKHSVTKAAGVAPLLSPPITAETFKPRYLENRRFIYFKLHGLPAQPFWYGDYWTTALTADQILQADLSDATVFVANCHLYQGTLGHYPSPMLTALLKAGARAVVGGPGPNWARARSLYGADVLGYHFRRLIVGLHFRPTIALNISQAIIKNLPRDPGITDALGFRIFQQ